MNWKFQDKYAWMLIAVLVSAFLAFFLSFQAGVLALLFAVTAWFVWEYPEEGFLLFIVMMPLLPMLKITQTIGTATLVKDVIIFALFLRTFVYPLLTKQLPYRRNILFAPIVALAAWSVFETLRADSLILGVLRLRDIGLYMMLYFGVLYLKHDVPVLKRRALWATASIVVVTLLAVYQWFFAVDSAVLRFDPVRELWIPRLSSVLAHPSILGEYLITAFTLLASMAVLVKRGAIRAASAFLCALMLPVILLTYSRGVWLGLTVAIGVMAVVLVSRYIARRGKLRRLGAYAVPAAAVLLILFSVVLRLTPAGGLVRSAIDPTYGSNEERIEFFVRLIAPLQNNEVLIGKGLGDVIAQNFRSVDLEAYDIASGASRNVQLTKNSTLVDNQYLKTFIEMGVVGLVVYGWLYWRFAAGALSSLRGSGNRIIALWGLGFLAAFVIQALFIDIWDIFPTNALFWIVAAIVSATAFDSKPLKEAS